MTDRLLHRVLVVLALVGIGIASYLTYVHYRGLSPICAINAGCEKVQSSRYAKVGGVPVPLIGLVGYVAILASLLVRGELARLATAGMAIGGFAFSVYLTSLELFKIHAICQWCVGSAIVMTSIAVLSTIRALRAPDDALLDASAEPHLAGLEPEGEPA
ncbi:MAG: vitamin K epoxide reductase family protein [Actinobacteria bacterium]|nr:vitamin K epoxide reductase family protein [Actinomycetota bacterium]